MQSDDALALFHAWLDTQTPTTRAAVLSAVLNRRNLTALSARRVAEIHAATRTATRAEVAKELGVSIRTVIQAITDHNQNVDWAG